jgi:hypothetical protein
MPARERRADETAPETDPGGRPLSDVNEPVAVGASSNGLFAKLRRSQRVIAFLVIVVCVLLFFLLPDDRKGWKGVHDLLPETVIACLAFLLVRTWLFKDDFEDKDAFITAITDRIGLGSRDALVEEISARVAERVGTPHGVCAVYHGFQTVPWQELFERAEEAEVVSRYAAAWFHFNTVPLKQMLDRGGTLRVCLADPGDDSALAEIGRQMAPGSEKTAAQVRDAVVATSKAVDNLAKYAAVKGNGGVVERHHADRMLNASWVRIQGAGRDKVVFASYDHYMPDGPRPQIDLIDLKADPLHRQADYLTYEWDALWAGGTAPAEPESGGAVPAAA